LDESGSKGIRELRVEQQKKNRDLQEKYWGLQRGWRVGKMEEELTIHASCPPKKVIRICGATSFFNLTKAAMTSALLTCTTNLISPLATLSIAWVSSESSPTSPRSKRRRTAILVEIDNFALSSERWRAAAGLRMAWGERGCGDEVEKENDRPEKREDEMGKATAVVNPERYARLRRFSWDAMDMQI